MQLNSVARQVGRLLSGAAAILLVVLGATRAGQFEERVQGITTVILARWGEQVEQGSGFFYHHLGPKDPAKEGPQWRAITGTWLVTNRHLLLARSPAAEKSQPDEKPVDTFSFHLRRVVGDSLEWEAVTLPRKELLRRALFHRRPEVDVAAIEISDVLSERLKAGKSYLKRLGVNREQLPDSSPIDVEAASDVIVIGYPRSFYDVVNLYPILKAGIVASAFQKDFGGQPYFLIDSRLFPGSSGSIVISKPLDLRVEDGRLLLSQTKEFAVLGIYSGSKIQDKEPVELEGMIVTPRHRLDLGVVWHARVIEEILKDGVSFAEAGHLTNR